MPLTNIILTIVVIGLIMWLVNTYVPMSQPIKQILNIFVAICVVIWLLNGVGLLGVGPVITFRR